MNDERKITIQTLIDDAVADLGVEIAEYDGDLGCSDADVHFDERIREIADQGVPIYNATLLEVALDDLTLACEEPEILAFDGMTTAVNVIAGVIYERLLEELVRHWHSVYEEAVEARCTKGEDVDEGAPGTVL